MVKIIPDVHLYETPGKKTPISLAILSIVGDGDIDTVSPKSDRKAPWPNPRVSVCLYRVLQMSCGPQLIEPMICFHLHIHFWFRELNGGITTHLDPPCTVWAVTCAHVCVCFSTSLYQSFPNSSQHCGLPCHVLPPLETRSGCTLHAPDDW